MGYIKHTALIVTASSPEIVTAHEKAKDIFGEIETGSLLSPIVFALTNGYASFMIAPHGSKAGWGTQANNDALRAEFMDWLDREDYLDYAEVYFGGDDADYYGVSRTKKED